MKRSTAILASILTAALAAPGCNRSAPDRGINRRAEPAVAPSLAVDVARVVTAPIGSELKLLGTTTALRHITLKAPSSGRLVDLNLLSGDVLRRGQTVAYVVSREDEAARAGLDVARQWDPQDAKSLAPAVKRYATGRGVPVTVPANAVVARRLASSGQYVAYLDPIADLVDPASIYVEAAVPINDEALVRPGMAAVVTSPVAPGEKFPARVVALSPSIEQNSVTSSARLEFTGPRRIRVAGAAVQVQVVSQEAPNAAVIPASALFQNADNGTFYVFVLGTDGRAHRRTVTVGIRTPAHVQVVRGLVPGETVITSGGYALSDNLKVRPLQDARQ